MAKQPSRKLCLSFVLGLGAAALSACGDNHTPPLGGALRLANLVGDSGGMQASISSVPAVGPVAFDGASGIVIVPEGSYQVQLTPQASGTAAYDVNGVQISQDTLATLFAYGSIGSSTQGGFVAGESLAAPAAGQVTMQTVVTAGGAQNSASHVYHFSFTPVGGSGQAADTSGSFGPPVANQTIALTAGRYEISVSGTLVCPPPAICTGLVQQVFDSGPQGVPIPGSNGANVFQLAVADATSAQQSQYGSAATLLLLDNLGGSTLLLYGQQ
jgi:hypothetical protein